MICIPMALLARADIERPRALAAVPAALGYTDLTDELIGHRIPWLFQGEPLPT
jgi:hypothetical protein